VKTLRSVLVALAAWGGTCLQADAPRLVNLSTRGQAGAGNNAMITGFVIAAGAPKTVLIRAVGPGLSASLPNTLANPALTLYQSLNGASTVIATNDDWLPADAATMQSVGAFALASPSFDAALVRTLDPGVYSAIVTGTATASNLAMVEVYEVSGGATRLVNLSTRALVGTGNNVLIAGLVVANNAAGTRRLLLRGAGPGLATIAPQLTGLLADPVMTVRNAVTNAIVATNDNWTATAEPAALYAAFSQAGAFPFAPNSLDAALVLDLPPGLYSVLISGAGNTTGIALAEVYDLTPDDTATSVSIVASRAAADESGANPGEFTLTRTGATTAPLTVTYGIGGTASYGTDYTGVIGTATIPAGSATVKITVAAQPDLLTEGPETVVLTLNPGGAAYSVGYPTVATVTIADLPPTLFVSNLRPTATAATSAASGTATVLLSPDNNFAAVSVAFSNLSSTETVAYVRLGNPGETGTELARLPAGQVDGAYWIIQASGAWSQADILQALRDGRIFVSIETTNFPAGELRGPFILGSGSQVFTAPAAAPVLDLRTVTDTDAARFLTQATFGPTLADIAALKAKGYTTWLDEQIAKPASNHRAETMADFAANNAGGLGAVNGVNTRPGPTHRQAAWWKFSLTGDDQLRQRVAFALSEIFVISDVNGTVFNAQDGAASYYDLLARDAFGTFRTLLEDVTLSPMMGVYLSHLRNARAESASSAQPDENYAREVMQLFTIGLSQLQPDGTLKLDAAALPIPTYDQTTVTETAKVFTGWAFYNPNPTANNFRNSAADYLNPMTLYATYHDTGAKTIVGGLRLSAGQTGTKDLKDTLDALANHANTGPFISRQLIQRLVTSNPSPAYVYRVAQVFANNGAGVRGDLGAVVRAILTDYEARAAAPAANPGYGKLKEPLLRVTSLLRAASVSSPTNRYAINNTLTPLAQLSLSAPTVFNFFEPDYVQPGPLAAAGLRAPEFQILTATTAISAPNYLYNFIFTTTFSGTTLTFTEQLPLATQPAALVTQLNLLLAGNAMSAAAQNRIVAALTALPASTTATDRVRAALYLVVTTPEGAIQQ
jgi:uncharacterized protein (DUF1800 family)